MIHHMNPPDKMVVFAIVMNGSPLFTGDAGSVNPRFAAGSWKMTGSKPSSHWPERSFTILHCHLYMDFDNPQG